MSPKDKDRPKVFDPGSEENIFRTVAVPNCGALPDTHTLQIQLKFFLQRNEFKASRSGVRKRLLAFLVFDLIFWETLIWDPMNNVS